MRAKLNKKNLKIRKEKETRIMKTLRIKIMKEMMLKELHRKKMKMTLMVDQFMSRMSTIPLTLR